MAQAAFRAGLGAQWTFLSDEKRDLVKHINILDETEGEYAYVAQPYTFVLRPDLSAADVDGWDSLSHIRLVLAVSKAFGVKFSASEIGNLKNVGEFADLIEKKA